MNKAYHSIGKSILLLSVLATTFSQVSAGHFFTYFPNATQANVYSTDVRTLGAIPFLAEVYSTQGVTANSQSMAICFDNFSTGDDVSYCEGETAILAGGYTAYNGGGTFSLTWTRITGGGAISYSSPLIPNQSGVTVTEINANFSTVNPPMYVPAPGETIARFELKTISSDVNCEEQKDTVIIYFDAEPDPVLTITADGAQQGIALPGGATATATICSGTNVSFIVANAPFPNAQETGFPVYYDVTVTDAGGIIPVDSNAVTDEYSAARFDTTFNNLFLTNTTGSSQSVILTLTAYYESDIANPSNDPGECAGQSVSYQVTVLNTAQATFGIVGSGSPNFCEGDPAPIRLTGTVNTTVTYRVDTVGGAMGAEQTVNIGATGIANLSVATDGLAGTSLEFVLISVEYQGGTACPQPAVGSQTINILDRPEGEFSLSFAAQDSVFCYDGAPGDEGIGIRLTTAQAGSYQVFYHISSASGFLSAPQSQTVTTAVTMFSGPDPVGTVTGVEVPDNNTAGDTLYIVLDSLKSVPASMSTPTCAAVIADSIFVIQEAQPFIGYILTATGQSADTLDLDNDLINLTVCDETTLTSVLDSSSTSVTGSELRARISIVDPNNHLGYGGTVTIDTTVAGFVFNRLLDLSNSATVNSLFSVDITPYYDLNGNNQLSGNDCDSEVLELNGTLLARPFATINVAPLMDTLVCAGETVDIVFTGPANASILLGIGNQGVTETIALAGSGTATRPSVINGTTLFTLISVTTAADPMNGVPACSNTLNRQLTIRTESLPTASISLVKDTVCFEESTMLMVNVSGTASAFTFVIDSAGTPITYTVLGDTMLAITEPNATGIFTLTSISNAGSMRSCSGTLVAPFADTLVVEEVPAIAVEMSFANSMESVNLTSGSTVFSSDTVCSGDTLLYTNMTGLLAISNDSSAQTTDSLYVKLDVIDPLNALPGLTATQIVKVTNGDLAAALNNRPLVNNLALATKIQFTFTPFYFDDTNGAPTAADFAAACQGEALLAEIVVRSIPRITFGGNTTVCEGSSTLLTFTGSPNGSITVSSASPDPGFPFGFANGAQLLLDNTGFTSITVNPSENAVYNIGNITDGSNQMCTSSTSLDVNVTVVPTPDVQFGYVTTDTCAGAPAVFELELGPAGALVYYHLEAFNGGAVLETGTVTLNGVGEARIESTIGIDSSTVIFLDSISTQSPIVCTAILGYDVAVDPQAAPNGELASNGPVCDGEEIQLTFTDLSGGAYLGTYALVINDSTYTGIGDGDVFAAKDTTTVYYLRSLVQEMGDLCSDTIASNIDTLDVIIEVVPATTVAININGTPNTLTAASTFMTTVCSGTPFSFMINGTPDTASTGDFLFYEVTLDDPGATLALGSLNNFMINIPAATANSFISSLLPSEVVYLGPNAADTITVTVVPYYEVDPMNPVGAMGSDACAGDSLDFKVAVLRQLARPNVIVSAPQICQGDSIQLNFTGGSPNTRVTFFYNGLTDQTDLDGAGNGTSEMIPLNATTNFYITGVATLPPAAACSRSFMPAVNMPDATVMVTPLPMVTSFGFLADTVCTDVGYNFQVTGTANAEVFYSINDVMVSTPLLLDAMGNGTITGTGMAPNGIATDSIISLRSIVTTTMPACTTMLDSMVMRDTVNVMPLPTGTLTVDGAACAGGTVDLIFTATSTPLRDSFRIRVKDAMGNFIGPAVFIASGDVAYTVSQPGIYYLERIRDNTTDLNGQLGNSCVNITAGTAMDNLGSVEVIIEDEPQLSANAQGTSGVINLNNQTFLNVLTTAVCSGDNLVVPFSTLTPNSQAADPTTNPLYVQVQATDAAGFLPQILPAAAGMGNNFVLPIDDLDFNGALENTTGAIQTLQLTITPYFEDSTDVTTRSLTECVGGALNFNITVLPEIVIAVDSAASNFEICVDGDLQLAITGPAGARVFYTAINATNVPANPVTLNAMGRFVITGNPVLADTVRIVLDSASLTTTVSGQARLCKVVLGDTLKIVVNELPDGFLSFVPAGPICNGETADLVFNTTGPDGIYNLILNTGEMVGPLTVVNGTAVISDDLAYTATNTDTLKSITDFNGCTTSGLSQVATLQVEAVPTANLTITSPVGAAPVALTNGDTESFALCTGTLFTSGATFSTVPLNGANWLEVTVTGVNFFGAPMTSFIPVADFSSDYTANLFNVGNTPLTTMLTITPYVETTPGAASPMREAGECAGDPIQINITVNPSPITVDIADETCSDVLNVIDLNSAITNGVTGVEFTYVVASSAPGDVAPAADCTSGCGTTIETVYTNVSANDVDITYTVTPTVGGCAGNSFDVVFTIKPEGILDTAAFNGIAVCSDEDINQVLGTTNGLTDDFRLVNVSFLNSVDFIADAGNAVIGSSDNQDLIGGDSYVNLTPNTVTVTYSVAPIGANGCIGDTLNFTVDVNPEPKVANRVIEICSGTRLSIDVIQDLVANQVGTNVTFRRRKNTGVPLIVLDGNNNDTQECDPAGNCNSGILNNNVSFDQNNFINDSIINIGTATVSLFYDIVIEDNQNNCADNSSITFVRPGPDLTVFGSVFTLEVRVREEADIEFTNTGVTEFCSGDPITLGTNFTNGGGSPTYVYSVDAQDPGITSITLTPSSTGSSVTIDGTGAGDATIRVTASDQFGCTATETIEVSIGDTPAPKVVQGTDSPCAGSPVPTPYSVMSVPGNTYQWSLTTQGNNFFFGGISVGPGIAVSWNSVGGPNVLTCVETSPSGCTTTHTLSVNVVSQANADFSFTVNPNSNLQVAFFEVAQGDIVSYSWDFGDNVGTSTNPNPNYTYTTAGTYQVELAINSLCGGVLVQDTITKPVTVGMNFTCQTLNFTQGANFFSLNIIPFDTDIENAFGAVPEIVQVNGFQNGVPTLYQPGGGGFNSLTDFTRGFGYIASVNAPVSVQICGMAENGTYRRPLDQGINYVGSTSVASISADNFFSTLVANGDLQVAYTFTSTGFLAYFPNGGGFNSLTSIDPGVGYVVVTNNPVGGNSYRLSGSEEHEFVFGIVSGEDFTADEPIEIINQYGEVIGNITATESGMYAATPIFGAYSRVDGSFADGLNLNEAYYFRHNGITVDAGLKFNGSYRATRLDLNFTAEERGTVTALPALAISPNPVVGETALQLQVVETGAYSITVHDVTGRTVSTIVEQDNLEAGQYTYQWNTTRIPSGVYTVMVTKAGVLMPELTQRVIK